MTLAERIKAAYDKTQTLPDRMDCYQPLAVLFEAEYGFPPSCTDLSVWMEKVLGSDEKQRGFLVGYMSDVPSPPSNAKEFSDGFFVGRSVVRFLAV
jgi:hypothetical protein